MTSTLSKDSMITRERRIPPFWAVTLVAMCGLGTGCSKKEEAAALLPAASSLAPSVAAPTAKVVKYTIDTKGKTSIDMEAPVEHIKADTDTAGGSLDVDLTNLTNTRGAVKIDVAN